MGISPGKLCGDQNIDCLDNATLLDDKDFHEFSERQVERRRIHQSATGSMWEMQDLQLEKMVMVKEVDCIQDTDLISPDDSMTFYHEVNMLTKIDQPGFTNLINWDIDNGVLKMVFDYQNSSTNLFEQQYKKNMSFFQVQLIFRQLTNTVAQLHNSDFVHGDLCPENVIVIETTSETQVGMHKTKNKFLHAKLIGMNACNQLKCTSKWFDESSATAIADHHSSDSNEDHKKFQPRIEGQNGNQFYTAPEIIETGFQDQKADVFSLGVMVQWMLTGKQPQEQITKEGMNRIKNGKQKIVIQEVMVAAKLPNKLIKLIKSMLEVDPDKRVTIFDVLTHSWFDEMERHAQRQIKNFVIGEELEDKSMIEKLMNVKFSNKLGRLIQFQLSEQQCDKEKMLRAGILYQKINKKANGKITDAELQDQISRYQNMRDSEKFKDKIFQNIDINNSQTVEFSEFKVCGMTVTLQEITGKLIRLFKLATRKTHTHVTLDEIMEAIQDGNRNQEWFKLYLADMDADDMKIETQDYLDMMRNICTDLKKLQPRKEDTYDA